MIYKKIFEPVYEVGWRVGLLLEKVVLETMMSASSSSSSSNSQIESLINHYLEFFAFEDAALLAELYHERVKSNDSLYIFGQCLLRSGQLEAVCSLLGTDGLETPQLRYLYAHCCYDLKRAQEAEAALRMDEEPRLHSVFEGTPVEPFAHTLLARILLESGRTDEAKAENNRAMERNNSSWSTMKLHCDIGAAQEVETVCTKLIRHASKARDVCKKRSSVSSSSQQPAVSPRTPEKRTPVMRDVKDLIEERALCRGPKKPRTSLAGKRTSELGLRRRLEEGMETRRSRTRRFVQDSENLATSGGDVRRTTRLRNSNALGGIARGLPDKQLRSINGMSEEDINGMVIDMSSSKTKPAATTKFNSSVQNMMFPLGSHDQNAHHSEALANVSTTSTSSGTTSVPPVASPRPNRPNISTVSRRFHSVSQLLDDYTKWTTLLVDIVETVAYLGRVQSFLSRYATSKALEHYDEMPEACITSPLGREIMARIFLERLDYSKTREVLERLHVDFPHRLAGMEVLSTALWHEQDSRRLSMLAAELTEKARNSAETWCTAGNCYSIQKQHETAIECFERAVTLKPQFAYAYSLLGHELLDTDQLDKAASSFRRALCLCPTDYRAWFGLGLLHFKREQLTWARFYLKRAVAINPYNSVLLCQLSVVEQSLRNNDAAMNLLNRALEIAPDNAACRFYRARLLYEMHKFEECKAALNELKLFAHDEAQVFFLLGRVHKKLNNTHLALLNFSWAAEMDPRGEQNQTTRSESGYEDDSSPSGVRPS